MNKSETLFLLNDFGYTVTDTEKIGSDFSEYAYTYNEENNIGFIIKEYEEFNVIEINSDVLKVRTKLKKLNYNVWNTYFLITFKKSSEIYKINHNKVYSIERNPKGLRKYILITEKDVYRIPFIKSEESNTFDLNFGGNIESIFQIEDEETKKFVQWLIENNGEYAAVNKNDLKKEINIWMRKD